MGQAVKEEIAEVLELFFFKRSPVIYIACLECGARRSLCVCSSALSSRALQRRSCQAIASL